jgi:hypothetical protein
MTQAIVVLIIIIGSAVLNHWQEKKEEEERKRKAAEKAKEEGRSGKPAPARHAEPASQPKPKPKRGDLETYLRDLRGAPKPEPEAPRQDRPSPPQQSSPADTEYEATLHERREAKARAEQREKEREQRQQEKHQAQLLQLQRLEDNRRQLEQRQSAPAAPARKLSPYHVGGHSHRSQTALLLADLQDGLTRDELARTILLAEMLGPPCALRNRTGRKFKRGVI